MSYLKAIRLENLRSLKDTGYIDLKPITILVGKNSVGKSTFLRTFPLLRQSCEKETRAPILWYGNLVDLGDFNTALNKSASLNDDINHIEFSFKLDLDNVRYFHNSSLNNSENFEVDISLRMKEFNKTSYASQLKIKVFENTITIKLNHQQDFESITINDNVFDKEYFKERGCTYKVFQKKLFPIPRLYKIIKIKEKKAEYLMDSELFKDDLVDHIYKLCRKNIKIETVNHLISSIPFTNTNEIYKYLCNQQLITGLAKKISDRGIESTYFKELICYFYLNTFEDLVRFNDDRLSMTFSSVRYLEPLRATAQRYYRRQELAIDEVDSKGSNIAMFLDSLNSSEKLSLNRILKDNFNIELNVTKENGHLALTIKNDEIKEPTNIADLGVGYSQILPFIIQLWDCTNKRKSSRSHLSFLGARSKVNSIFVVEQPELHLHPAYQAKISDVISKMYDKNNLNLIIETHSPHIIYRFGELIELNEIDKDDVQVLIFEEGENGTSIRKSIFDSNGRLQNWPIGFFQP